jgi:single-stranded DNA-binding protein
MLLKLQFVGIIHKVEVRQAGQKTVAEVSAWKKKKDKDGNEEYCWIKVTIWEPKDWQIKNMTKGRMIGGCGDFWLRSYTDKDGNKRQSAEVSCNSFDIETQSDDRGEASKQSAPRAESTTQQSAPSPTVRVDEEPPF